MIVAASWSICSGLYPRPLVLALVLALALVVSILELVVSLAGESTCGEDIVTVFLSPVMVIEKSIVMEMVVGLGSSQS